MGRNRVLSFMSQFSAGTRTPSLSSSPPNKLPGHWSKQKSESFVQLDSIRRPVTPPSHPNYGSLLNGSPHNSNSPTQRPRSTSRPLSMVQAYQPPLMDINEDTIPELQPIFTFLNSHSNKLYQEGYFLKLDDQNTQGKPNPDRTWTECFAQLVGTVLFLWDAAELDAAGEDGEVPPKFINLTDASIKMIESLPTRSSDEKPLQNILSISTAGRNRYLLHFNSHHSLIQWTAGIRLAMYEHSTLQEAYTGALVAGRGKSLNNINVIMERSRIKTEEWVRVRFGAGVPWRRCWCVITPPDEKEFAKLQKELKKRSPYDRSPVPVLKGDIKFYDTRKDGKKQKKSQPIATITDAYSAYAIYPQAKSLVDASTLLKIEGNVTVHSDPPSSTEGFVFVMPETHPAVSGFEMLLRFLFPTWDTFGLYGRPGRLVASVLDHRSLMFALPKHKRYGYLELLDVSTLILEDNSSSWAEKTWRKRLKEATGTRMNAIEDGTRSHSRSASRSSARLNNGGGAGASSGKPRVGFATNQASVRSSRSFSFNGGSRIETVGPEHRGERLQPPVGGGAQSSCLRNVSDPNHSYNDFAASRDRQPSRDRTSSDEEGNSLSPEMRELEALRHMQTPEPVSRPPAFNHGPTARPTSKAYHSPELRRANSRLSSSTLDQMVKAGGMSNVNNVPPSTGGEEGVFGGRSVYPHASPQGTAANGSASHEALSPSSQDRPPGNLPPPPHATYDKRSRSPMGYHPQGPSHQLMVDTNYPQRPHTSDGRRPTHNPGPPRSPNAQHSHRPDQPRLPPGGPPGPLGPGGPSPPHGRGRPPNQRPPPPGHGLRPDQRGNYGPGFGPRPFAGPQGRAGPPPNFGQPQRKPLPAKAHQSLTPNDIIEHYVSDAHRGGPFPPDRRQPAPPHHAGHGFGGPEGYRNGSHTSAGTDHAYMDPRAMMQRPARTDFAEMTFGSTADHGAAPTPPRLRAPASAEPVMPDQVRRTQPEQVAHYAGPFTGADHHRLAADPRPQQRAASPMSSHYTHGGNLSTGAPGREVRTSPQPLSPYDAAGSAGGGAELGAAPPPPPQHGGSMNGMGGTPGSFSRLLRAGAHSPPGMNGVAPDTQNLARQYKGQAF